MKSKTFSQLLKEIHNESEIFRGFEEDGDSQVAYEEFPLTDERDVAILAHRDAHFSGSFQAMLEYYARGGRGVSEEFDVEDIQRLVEIELNLQQNLAPMLLTGSDMERIAKARHAYQKLRHLLDEEREGEELLRLLAELILAEEDNLPDCIENVVQQKQAAVPSLLALLKSEDFSDPLFPGYGQGPALAAECLGEISDPSSLKPLFESIDEDNPELEETILKAFSCMGETGRDFLLQVVQSRPITRDNKNAAMILASFPSDPHIASACFQLLQDNAIWKSKSFATYLVLCCEALANTPLKEAFITFSGNPDLPAAIAEESQVIVKNWKKMF